MPLTVSKPPTYTPKPCRGCGRSYIPSTGCQYCKVLAEYWHKAQRDHPHLPRELCILIGSMVAGLNEAYVTQCGRGRKPEKNQCTLAIQAAAAYMEHFGYYESSTK